MADDDIEPGPRSDDDPYSDSARIVTASVDALSENVNRLRGSFESEREDNRKIQRRQRIKLAIMAVLLIAVGVLAFTGRRQSEQIISDRAVARQNACVNWNDLVNVVKAGDVNNAEALIKVTEPDPSRVLTPEQTARRDAIVRAYRDGVAAGVPQLIYRDCSPAGVKAFYETKRPTQITTTTTG